MELRAQILDTAAKLFQAEGLGFTMQQVAAALHISKKTIYTVYSDKEALLLDMVDMLFEKIHRRKAELAALPVPLEDRLQAVIIALPEEYAALDFRQLDALEEKYPVVAARVRRHLETGWEPTIQLLEQGIAEKRIRPVNLTVLRRILTAAFQQLLSGAEDGSSYAAELEDMMDILMNGIKEVSQ
ncbi:MAG: TetR/AcrR family transcriptional regulator [Candidatus Faecousia sp.]|nr:TetR/AcrR family transcriptional regulator [Candidatus Faecousia sp.]